MTVDKSLYTNIEEICVNCKNLLHLKIGHQECKFDSLGRIWDGKESLNTSDPSYDSTGSEDSDDSQDEDFDEEFELNVKHIASNLNQLRSLHINSGIQLERQPVAPASLDELTCLEELRLCSLRPGINCDNTRDEWNLRKLAQSSTRLRILDLRGCYLKILSLGWLKTEQLEALHIYYQVPAASVLSKWRCRLKYLTLAKISTRYKTYRSMGPVNPGEELDACLRSLATAENSQLLQLDLQESDCSLDSLVALLTSCKSLHYIDTRRCEKLPQRMQVRCVNQQEIKTLLLT